MPAPVKIDEFWINPAAVLYITQEPINRKTVIHFTGKDIKVPQKPDEVASALRY